VRRSAKNNLTLGSRFSAEFNEAAERYGHDKLYQLASLQIIDRAIATRVFTGVGDALTAMAEGAYASRHLDLLEEVSCVLTNLPLGREYNIAGRYFRALERLRRGDREEGERLVNSVLAEPSHRYTARAMQSLGAVFHARNDFESALKVYAEAGRHSIWEGVDPLAAIYTQMNIAVIKGTGGDHLSAAEDLKHLIPFARSVGLTYPQLHYTLLNAVAVELSEGGNLEEARRMSEIAVASPFIRAYPEWTETYADIQSKLTHSSRSLVALSQSTSETDRGEFPARETQIVRRGAIKNNRLVSLPERPISNEMPEYRGRRTSPARILDFQRWKQRSRPESSQAGPPSLEQMSEMTIGEKLIRLMDLISHDDTDDETIDVILKAVEAIVSERRGVS